MLKMTVTRMLLLCLFGITLYCSIKLIYGDESDILSETVLQVHVIFRHGDRMIDETESYPNDPNINIDFYPLSLGQLTNNGKLRAYRLGQMLRKRYNNFLGEFYNSEIVQTISTDYDRTKMSAQLVLAGLFPPVKAQQWDHRLLWQPIPTAYITEKEDTWFDRPITYCPVYREEYLKFSQAISEDILTENQDLMDYIYENSGKRITSIHSLFNMQQTQYVEEQMNLTLPNWVRNIYPEPLSTLAAKQIELESYTPLLKRLNGGNFLRKIITDIQDKIDGNLEPQGRKIYLYSGHETNAVNMLVALDVWDNQVPLFSSATIIELIHRVQSNEYGLRIYYHDQRSDYPKLIKIPGCLGSFCEINRFLEVAKDIIPDNYTLECGSEVDIHTFPKY
ncbi:venom acid phosphatase Acph-1-like [Chrysoperla carnea]|uniref:venom acid phosphatase Acph-1-like n=1 Tax=Chrysoperla carnea TaxID=189513 RepID=UPI001D06ECBF|nr:venom acid phosphatase Acph-1-like [Chrysoperla carnea]